MIPDHIHHELLNWSRWLAMGPVGPMGYRLASAEREALRDSGYSDEDAIPQVLPNARRAEVVHRLYESLTLPEKRTIDVNYLEQHPTAEWGEEAAAKKVKMLVYVYQLHFRSAIRWIERGLEGCATAKK